jgi:hypothetical protein
MKHYAPPGSPNQITLDQNGTLPSHLHSIYPVISKYVDIYLPPPTLSRVTADWQAVQCETALFFSMYRCLSVSVTSRG